MAWTYSGDPSANDVDKYRFFIGDTNAKEPILQDGEVQFVVNTYDDHNTRLYHLYDAAANFFARKIERTVGPITEKPFERQKHYASKAAQYRMLVTGVGLSMPVPTKSIFNKGMHDNGRY